MEYFRGDTVSQRGKAFFVTKEYVGDSDEEGNIEFLYSLCAKASFEENFDEKFFNNFTVWDRHYMAEKSLRPCRMILMEKVISYI